MDIFEYLDFIKPRMKESYDRGDKEEFIRLVKVLVSTLEDLTKKWRLPMLFQQIKRNFLVMEFDEQLLFMTDYIERRQADLTKTVITLDTTKAKKTTKKDKQLKLTGDQFKLLKQLGLV